MFTVLRFPHREKLRNGLTLQIFVIVDDFSLLTSANISELMLPLGFDSHSIDFDVQVHIFLVLYFLYFCLYLGL